MASNSQPDSSGNYKDVGGNLIGHPTASRLKPTPRSASSSPAAVRRRGPILEEPPPRIAANSYSLPTRRVGRLIVATVRTNASSAGVLSSRGPR